VIVAITMVRDEADIIEASIRHTLAEGADLVIVADNLSADDTRPILDRLAATLPVEVVDDPEPAYNQAEKMTALAQRACERGSTWVWPFDADEFFTSPQPGERVCDVLSRTTADVVLAHGFDHIVREGAPEGSLQMSPWRRAEPQTLGKVIFRADPDARLEMGNHSVSPAFDIARGVITYRHFQYRSAGQMVRKLRQGAAAYAASTVHELHGTHWREGGKLDDDQMADKWATLCAEDGLVFDPAPIGGRTVSVVIPTRDRADLLAVTVEAVERTAPDAEIVIAEGKASFAENCNRGALRATGDVLVFLNDDTQPQPGWLDPLTRNVGWGIAGAQLLNPDGSLQHSGVFFRRNGGALEAFNSTDPRPSGEVPAVTGACLAIEADLFAHLGGFDTDFVNGYEDTDLCLRARQAGVRCFYAAESRVVHELSQSAGRFARVGDNINLLQKRWGHLRVGVES